MAFFYWDEVLHCERYVLGSSSTPSFDRLRDSLGGLENMCGTLSKTGKMRVGVT
jgi:hypothetical protein